MLFNVGTDLLDMRRVEKIGVERLAKKILTLNEAFLLEGKSKRRKLELVAGRFVAKEAIFKAMGSIFKEGFSFQDIEVLPDSFGKPEVFFSKDYKKYREKVKLSISHCKDIVIAFAIFLV